MNKARGTDVNTLLVFLRCIRSYVDMLDGVDNIITVWDARLERESSNFRKDAADTDYKGTRDRESLAEAHALDDQIYKAIESIGGMNMFPNRMEADDVIAWLTHTLTDHQITIVTVDQDMYQLINENVNVYSPIKKININTHNFEEVTGTNRKDFLSYKALIGDKSDNIPGIPKVGKKTALKILDKGIESELTPDNLLVYKKNIELMDLSYGYTVHDREVDVYEDQLRKLQTCTQSKNDLKRICIHNAVYDISNNIDVQITEAHWYCPTSGRFIRKGTVEIKKLDKK